MIEMPLDGFGSYHIIKRLDGCHTRVNPGQSLSFHLRNLAGKSVLFKRRVMTAFTDHIRFNVDLSFPFTVDIINSRVWEASNKPT